VNQLLPLYPVRQRGPSRSKKSSKTHLLQPFCFLKNSLVAINCYCTKHSGCNMWISALVILVWMVPMYMTIGIKFKALL
jgi:hypothetical protein